MGKHDKQLQKKRQVIKAQRHPRLCECSRCKHRFNSAQSEPVCPKCYTDEVDFVNPNV